MRPAKRGRENREQVAEAHPAHLVGEAHVDQRGARGGVPGAEGLPAGAAIARRVPTRPLLHGLLRRAFGLSRTLPRHLVERFAKRVATMPRSTEAERLVVQRVGQDLFRDALLDDWQGGCAVTGLAVSSLLRESHMKPWAKCASDDERLDVFNGLLLSANLDAAFDAGLVTFDDAGLMVCSPALPPEARALLGWSGALRLRRIEAAHRAYPAFHRANEFKGSNA